MGGSCNRSSGYTSMRQCGKGAGGGCSCKQPLGHVIGGSFVVERRAWAAGNSAAHKRCSCPHAARRLQVRAGGRAPGAGWQLLLAAAPGTASWRLAAAQLLALLLQLHELLQPGLEHAKAVSQLRHQLLAGGLVVCVARVAELQQGRGGRRHGHGEETPERTWQAGKWRSWDGGGCLLAACALSAGPWCTNSMHKAAPDSATHLHAERCHGVGPKGSAAALELVHQRVYLQQGVVGIEMCRLAPALQLPCRAPQSRTQLLRAAARA